jgi:hypothetical protein
VIRKNRKGKFIHECIFIFLKFFIFIFSKTQCFGLSHTSVGAKSGAAMTAAAFADCDDEDESGASSEEEAAADDDEVVDGADEEEDEDEGGGRREPRRMPSTRGSISAKSASSAGPAGRSEMPLP